MKTIMNKKIIAFAGRKRCGKGALATYMAEQHNGTIVTVANNLKKLCCELLGFDSIDELNYQKDNSNEIPGIEKIDSNLFAEIISKSTGIDKETILGEMKPLLNDNGVFKPTSVRYILQFVGTNIIRNLCPDWHVQKMVEEINNAPTNLVLVDDVRFPNERNAVEELGGTVFFIMRPDTKIDVSNHESETSLHWYDFTDDRIIINYNTLELLQEEFNTFYLDNFYFANDNIILASGCRCFNNANRYFGTYKNVVNYNQTEIELIKMILNMGEYKDYGVINFIALEGTEARKLEKILCTSKKPLELAPHLFTLWNPFIIENLKEWQE